MWLKFTKPFLILVFLSITLFITGCMEEPTVDPVKKPFSVVRVGNFLSNADIASIDVTIDKGTGEVQTFTIEKNSNTSYVDIPSGKRHFTVKNSATKEVIFDKDLQIISYEEMSIFFAGNYSTDLLKNTFAQFATSDGDTYLSTPPPAGKAYLYFVHLAGDTPDQTSKPILVRSKFTPTGEPTDTTTFTKKAIAFSNMGGATVKAGNYLLSFINGVSQKDTLAKSTVDITAGYIYTFYVSGQPAQPTVTSDSRLPFQARAK